MHYHAKHLRQGRYSQPQQIYLITFCTHQRQPLWQHWPAGRLVVHALHRWPQEASTLAYVVMPDHVHWLMQLGFNTSLSRCVQRAKAHVSRHWPGHHPIWQHGFHDHALRNEAALKPTARYIIMNPVRAGLVTSIKHYPLWDALWV